MQLKFKATGKHHPRTPQPSLYFPPGGVSLLPPPPPLNFFFFFLFANYECSIQLRIERLFVGRKMPQCVRNGLSSRCVFSFAFSESVKRSLRSITTAASYDRRTLVQLSLSLSRVRTRICVCVCLPAPANRFQEGEFMHERGPDLNGGATVYKFVCPPRRVSYAPAGTIGAFPAWFPRFPTREFKLFFLPGKTDPCTVNCVLGFFAHADWARYKRRTFIAAFCDLRDICIFNCTRT